MWPARDVALVMSCSCAPRHCYLYSPVSGKLPIDQEVYSDLKSTGLFEVMSLEADEVRV